MRPATCGNHRATLGKAATWIPEAFASSRTSRSAYPSSAPPTVKVASPRSPRTRPDPFKRPASTRNDTVAVASTPRRGNPASSNPPVQRSPCRKLPEPQGLSKRNRPSNRCPSPSSTTPSAR